MNQRPDDALVERAWQMYCDDMRGDLHYYPCWEQLPLALQTRYLERATHRSRPFDLMARLADAEHVVRMVDRVGSEAIANNSQITLTHSAALFTAAANYLVKYERS